MRKTRTRILSLRLVLVMCLGLLPMTAMAAGGSSGVPALFLDPEQEGFYYGWVTSVTAEPFFRTQGLPAGKPEPTTYTVRLLDQDSGEVIEVGNRYEGGDSIDLRNRYSRIGYRAFSFGPFLRSKMSSGCPQPAPPISLPNVLPTRLVQG